MPVPPRPVHGRLTAALAVLATGAALGSGLPVTAHARPASSVRGWVATATRAVSYTGKRLGATDAAQPVHLTVALQPRDAAAMQQRLRAIYTPGSTDYHRYLSARQWRSAYAPRAADVARVTRYLRAEGFTGISVTGNRMAVTATGTAARAEHAFATRLVDFRHGHDVVFGNVTPAQVPASLADVVSGVIGLNDLPVDLVKARRAAAGSPSTDGLYPGQFATTYGAAGTTTGRAVSIALLTEGETASVLKQLRFAEQKEKSRACR